MLNTLEFINSDSRVAKEVSSYFAFVPFGDPSDAAGPDLLAMWYQRNVHIYHNIGALAGSPSDRILVIYGAGHLGWLRQNIANDSTVKLRKLSDLTGQQQLDSETRHSALHIGSVAGTVVKTVSN